MNTNQNYNGKVLKADAEKFAGMRNPCKSLGGSKCGGPPVIQSRFEKEFEDYRKKTLFARLNAKKEIKMNPSAEYPSGNI